MISLMVFLLVFEFKCDWLHIGDFFIIKYFTYKLSFHKNLTYVSLYLQAFVNKSSETLEQVSYDGRLTTITTPNGSKVVTIGTQTPGEYAAEQQAQLEQDGCHLSNQNLASLYHGSWPIDKQGIYYVYYSALRTGLKPKLSEILSCYSENDEQSLNKGYRKYMFQIS